MPESAATNATSYTTYRDVTKATAFNTVGKGVFFQICARARSSRFMCLKERSAVICAFERNHDFTHSGPIETGVNNGNKRIDLALRAVDLLPDVTPMQLDWTRADPAISR